MLGAVSGKDEKTSGGACLAVRAEREGRLSRVDGGMEVWTV